MEHTNPGRLLREPDLAQVFRPNKQHFMWTLGATQKVVTSNRSQHQCVKIK